MDRQVMIKERKRVGIVALKNWDHVLRSPLLGLSSKLMIVKAVIIPKILYGSERYGD